MTAFDDWCDFMHALTEDHLAPRASGGRRPPRWLREEAACWLATGMKGAGMLLLVICALSYLDAWVYQATEEFHLGVDRLRAASAPVEKPVAKRAPVERDYAVGDPMGSLQIPRLGLSVIVAHGTDSSTLRRAVGHVPGTSFPGQDGNVGLAGHRDTFFRALQSVREKDVVHLVTREGDYAYRVVDTAVVPPNRVDVLAPTAVPSVTLVTCYPFDFVGSAPYRFVVRGERIRGSASVRGYGQIGEDPS